nr:3-hydroxyacyl-CoA dehydrogenase family protein [Mesorhizobium sp. ES1-4]
MADLAGADLVIEAGTEDETVKHKIYAQLCPQLNPDHPGDEHVIDLDHTAGFADRPAGTLHGHTFHESGSGDEKLVELVRGIDTEDQTLEVGKNYVKQLDKTITLSEDFPACIVNRILLRIINDAIYTLYKGVGTVGAIDTAMKLGANHPMGPLQLADSNRFRHVPVDHAGAA